MPRARSSRTSAFTLIELLTVIAIIAILASLSIGILRGSKQRASIARAKSELAVLAQALETFKQRYGDYPQTGPSPANAQRVTGTTGPGIATVPAVFFNALIGVYGPNGAAGGRINGPTVVDISKLALEVPLTAADRGTLAIPVGSPPAKPVANNAFVDPWGNRYLYFYKRPGPGAGTWLAPSFLLYSTGPDGAATAQPNASGIFTGTTQSTGDNADNLYADKLP